MLTFVILSLGLHLCHSISLSLSLPLPVPLVILPPKERWSYFDWLNFLGLV